MGEEAELEHSEVLGCKDEREGRRGSLRSGALGGLWQELGVGESHRQAVSPMHKQHASDLPGTD